MLTARCPRDGVRVLLSNDRIRALHNTADGIVVELECHDGEYVVVVTGRRATGESPGARLERECRALSSTG